MKHAEVKFREPHCRWTCSDCKGEFLGFKVPETLVCAVCAIARIQRQPSAKERRLARLSTMSDEEVLIEAGCPERYARTSFRIGLQGAPSSWPLDVASGSSLEGWRDEPWCALLIGPTGTGKTMFAREIFLRALRSGASAIWARADELVRRLWSSERSEIARRVEQADFLVIDDLGSGHDRTWDPLTTVVASRYDRLSRTLVTTNKTGPELIAADPRLHDRIRTGLVFRVEGQSLRQAGAK